MRIAISLYSVREVYFLFSSSLLSLISEDNSNQYIIFFDDCSQLKPIFDSFDNVTLEEPFQGNKFRRFVYQFAIRPYEKISFLLEKQIGDHAHEIASINSFNKTFVFIGYVLTKIFKLIDFSHLLRLICYKTSYYNKYHIDRWLITEYHSFKEKVISYNTKKEILFFQGSHDNFTLDGKFNHEITKYLVWDKTTKRFATNIAKIPSKRIQVVGNPLLETIATYKTPINTLGNKILFFGNNNTIYNEVSLVKEIKSNPFLDSLGVSLRISPSVGGVGKEWTRRKDSYERILSKENILMPTNSWFGGDFESSNINEEYLSSLWKHEIFIVTGVTNIAYDILTRGGVLVLMFYDNHKEKEKFDWWSCEQREVHDHIKNLPGVLTCYSIKEIEEKLKLFLESKKSFYSETPYLKHLKSSEIIFQEIIKPIT